MRHSKPTAFSPRYVLIACALLAWGATLSAAQPADVYVDDAWVGQTIGVEVAPGKIFGTNAFATVHDGYDAVTTGGTVHIAPGLYDFSKRQIVDIMVSPSNPDPITVSLLLNKSVRLLGPQFGIDPRPIAYPSGNMRRDETDPATEAILDGGLLGASERPQTLICVFADDVYIDGLVIKTGIKDLVFSGKPLQVPIFNTQIRYCVVKDSETDEGIQLKAAQNSLLEFNYVHHTQGDCLNISIAPLNSIIRFNQMSFSNSKYGGIYAYEYTGLTTPLNYYMQGNVINDVLGQKGAGLCFGADSTDDNNARGGILKDNIIFNCYDGIRCHMSDVLIEGNEIFNCPDAVYGLIAFKYPVNNITIRNNRVHDNLSGYTKSTGSVGNNIAALQIWNKAGFDFSTWTVENNEFWNNAYTGANPAYKGYAIHNGRFVSTGAPADRLVTQNNYFGHVTGPDDDEGIINGQGDCISAGVDVLPILFYPQEFNPDSDSDGITDQIEKVLGTDPYSKDTDGDGVEDGVEWWMGSTMTNDQDVPPVLPSSGDTDGDGFPDIYEVSQGTDPNDPNSHPPLGDINHNGRVDNIDAVIVFQIALGAIDLTEFIPEVPIMDVDRDTFITYLDAIDIFDFFLGNIDTLPTN